MEEQENTDARELAIHRSVSRLNYSRRCAEASAVQVHMEQGLPLAPGMEISYVVKDAKKWEVDPARTASEFDSCYCRGLLEKVVLSDLLAFIKVHDPDVILFPYADTWVPQIVKKARSCGFESTFSRSGWFNKWHRKVFVQVHSIRDCGGRSIKGKFFLIFMVSALLCISALCKEQTTKAWYSKGIFRIKLGRYEEAIQAFDKAIEINPQFAKARYSKGGALYNLGKYNEAIRAFDKAIELDPQFVKAWYSKGSALYNLGKYNEAVEALDKAIEIEPQYAEAWSNKSFALKALGRTTEADAAFAKAKELWYTG